MRIVFLTHNYPRFAGDVSGAFLATLATALQDRGHRLTVIAPSDGGEVGAPALDGVIIRRIRYAAAERETLAYRGTMADAARKPLGALAAWNLGKAMRRAVREEIAGGAEVIHAHWWVPAGLAAPPEAPLVLTIHGTDAILLKSAPARWLARPLFRRANVVTAVSDSAAALIAQHTGRAVRGGHVQPMPVDQKEFVRWSAGGGGLLAVARLTAQKRIELALEAVARLRDQAIRLTVVGDGPERARLEALRVRLGLTSRVQFLGARSPKEVAHLLFQADVAIFPARDEGFGLAAAEALMAGVPVVACLDGGGVLSVVPDGGAGRLVPADPLSIAHAVEELLGSAASRLQAQEAGRQWRDRLSPGRVAEACEGWYHEALDAR